MPSTRGRVVRGTQAVASPGFPTPALGASQLHTPRRKRNTSSGLSYRCLTPPLSWARKAAQASPFWAWRAHKGREDSTSPGSCQDLPRALPPAQGSNRNSFPSSRQAGRQAQMLCPQRRTGREAGKPCLGGTLCRWWKSGVSGSCGPFSLAPSLALLLPLHQGQAAVCSQGPTLSHAQGPHRRSLQWGWQGILGMRVPPPAVALDRSWLLTSPFGLCWATP